MNQISFMELKEYVNARTKAVRVPSAGKLMEDDSQPVMHGRFGKFGVIKIVDGDRTVFQSLRGGTFEEITLYPAGGCLAGNDLSQQGKEITVRSDDGMTYCVSTYNKDLHVFVDGIQMPDGMWLPEMQMKKWRSGDGRGRYKEFADMERERFLQVMDRVSEITVYMSGYAVYYSGGRHSVFALCKCSEYRYVSVADTVRLDKEKLAMLPWHIFLTMVGEDRNAKNSRNKKQEERWDYDGEDIRFFEYFVSEYFRGEVRGDLLWELLLMLDAENRNIILLYFFDGWKQDEIAAVFHYSRETISRRIREGIRKMREAYREMK